MLLQITFFTHLTVTILKGANELVNRMYVQFGPETGLIVLGTALICLALFAVVAQYFGLPLSISPDKFFLTPYLKFAYVSFLKPHTGRADGGQQSALESFYAAQVRQSISS